MTRTRLAIAFAAALFSTGANAQSNCSYAADQASLNRCADQALKAADATLNRTYKALMRQLDAPSQQRLKKAQRAWIAYKDAQCAFEAEPYLGGSIHPMVLATCLEAVTTSQTGLLEKRLYCEEGDVSCVRQ